MSGISTHVLDVTLGRPAAGVAVWLEQEENGAWREIVRSKTDADGRVQALLPGSALCVGRYRVGFATGEYFRGQGSVCFHPYIEIAFEVADASQKYHLPLLISPYSYFTYRGS